MTAVSFVGRQKVIDKQLEALGLWSKMGLMSQFKEVELLDDALDHWGAAVHVKVLDSKQLVLVDCKTEWLGHTLHLKGVQASLARVQVMPAGHMHDFGGKEMGLMKGGGAAGRHSGPTGLCCACQVGFF